LGERPKVLSKTGVLVPDFKPDSFCQWGLCVEDAMVWLEWPGRLSDVGYCSLHAIEAQAVWRNRLTVRKEPAAA
jgi:hypothetical protein